MNKTEAFFEFIETHLKDKPSALRLKFAGKEGLDYQSAITQIECRQKFGKKLAQTLSENPYFIFPSVLAGEQSTSDLLAQYHTTLLLPGTVADLTAGLGIDALHFASIAQEVTAVEIESFKAETLRENAAGLEGSRDGNPLSVVCADCRDFIDRGVNFDTIFIDPARRAADGSRTYALSDCQPDVLEMLPRLSEICKRLVIKASPMLDIWHIINELNNRPQQIIALGNATECKELLAVIDFGSTEPTEIKAVTLKSDGSSVEFCFKAEDDKNAPTPEIIDDPYQALNIYEPWPSLMKVGAHRLIAERFGLKMFHPNTRIFTSDKKVESFPGNIYPVVEVLPYSSSVIKRFSRKYPRINVATRNFPLGADALRTKLRVSDGGNLRLYGVCYGRSSTPLLIVTEIL